MGIVDGALRIDDTPGAGRAIDQVELAAERNHDDASVVGDVDVHDAAGSRSCALAASFFGVREVLLAGPEQVGNGGERLDCAGSGVELVEVGCELAGRRAPEEHRAVAGGGERSREAEAEIEGRTGVGKEVSIELWPGHGLGGSAGGERDGQRQQADRHRAG